MLNNAGPSNNEGFTFSSQFGQQLPGQQGGAQNVFAGQKALGAGRMQSAAQQLAAQQAAQLQQRQRMSGPPAGGMAAMQQQHFQYGGAAAAQQQRGGPQQGGSSALLGALGQQLGRGGLTASAAAFPALAQAQQARPGGGGVYSARSDRATLEAYLSQQPAHGALAPRGGLDGARGGLTGAASLHAGKGLAGGHGAPSTSQPAGKHPGAFSGHLGHRLASAPHPKDALGKGAYGDADTVFDTSDFPALGMGGAGGGGGDGGAPSVAAMLGNVHMFAEPPSYGAPASPAAAKPAALGPRALLDQSDFPALGGGAHALLMSGGRGAAAHVSAPPFDAPPLADPGKGVPPKAEPPADSFGLMGLLSVIRMTDPDMTTLALGLDLQTLGLNLNATESLHRTFASPWSEESRAAALDPALPACYLFPPQKLDAGCMGRFTTLSVFYVFYAHAGGKGWAERLG